MLNSLVSVCSLQYYKLMLVRCHCSSSSSVILCLSCLLHLLLLHGFFTTLYCTYCSPRLRFCTTPLRRDSSTNSMMILYSKNARKKGLWLIAFHFIVDSTKYASNTYCVMADSTMALSLSLLIAPNMH